MAEEQQKAIDACKDQAARELNDTTKSWGLVTMIMPDHLKTELWHRAMQLYGEQCRKDSAIAVLKRLHGLDDYDTSSVLEEIRKEIEN